MDRTYNVYIDNGLYVLGYYLEKDIKDITVDEIMENKEVILEKIVSYLDCDYYKKYVCMGFQNSYYTQKSKKIINTPDNLKFIQDNKSIYNFNKDNDISIQDRYSMIKHQFKVLLEGVGDDDYCTFCGCKHISFSLDESYLGSLSRSLMPQLHANTFYNFSNNLNSIDACPICLYLSMISLLNATKTGDTLTLYVSDDDDFMEDYTYSHQIEVNQNIAIDLQCDNKFQISSYKNTQLVIEKIIHNKKMYDGYIQSVSFNNSSQTEIYRETCLKKKDMLFVKKLEEKSLLPEFKLTYLFNKLIDGRLQNNYIPYVMDFEKQSLRVSVELFNEIKEVYNKLSNDKMELIKSICNKVYNTNNKNQISQLKTVDKLNKFEELLLKWNELYQDQTGESLFNTVEEFQSLCNYKEFKRVKNTMLMQFMLIK